mgnify:CR=1 FL=1
MFDDELWFIKDGTENQALSEKDTEVIKKMIDAIRERYPEAYKALSKEYQKSAMNVPYYQFLIVRRFCKCNFGKLDTTTYDIDNLAGLTLKKLNAHCEENVRTKALFAAQSLTPNSHLPKKG